MYQDADGLAGESGAYYHITRSCHIYFFYLTLVPAGPNSRVQKVSMPNIDALAGRLVTHFR